MITVKQKAFKVNELAEYTGTSRRTIYRKIDRARDYGHGGIIEVGTQQFFVVTTKSGPLFYESLISTLEALCGKEYTCSDCSGVISEVIKNAS